jgi:serine/threonine protein kinase
MAEDAIAASGRQMNGVGPGSTLGPYRIERQIGRGGMSIVYEAKHITLDRILALKVLLPSLSGDQAFVDRFLAEARAAARLDYPHIVPVYDCGDVRGVKYIAMKLLEGQDLKRVLDARRQGGNRSLPLDRAISIASQAAGALEYAHVHRVIHRDIKPANIYVDANDRVTLVDFGIARALDYSSSTLTGTVIGTPTYMSPEQAQGKPADVRSDIYSLGIVIYEMLAGIPPFFGDPQGVMYAHVHTPPPPLDAVRANLPPGVRDVVLRALAKQPDERFQNAGALALALSNAAGDQLAARALDLRSMPDSSVSNVRSDLSEARVESGTHERMAGGITHGTMAQSDKAARPAGTALPVAVRWRQTSIIAAGGAAVLIAAVLGWAMIVGPLAGGGRLTVTSEPAGATVTVDGNKLGVTPLAEQKLPRGTHQVVIDKPTFETVKRTETVAPRETDTLRATMTPLRPVDVLAVKDAAIGVNVSVENEVVKADQATQVKVNQPGWLIVRLAQKDPGVRDVAFRWEMALYDSSGTRKTSSQVKDATIAKDDVQGHTFAANFTISPNADGSAPEGTYEIRLFLNDDEAVAKSFQLVK